MQLLLRSDMAEQEISVSEYAAELVTIVRYCREMPFLFLAIRLDVAFTDTKVKMTFIEGLFS